MKIINQIKRTFSKDLDFLIFFVTTKCNSRCRHCFFWKSLNHKDELKIDEIEQIFKNVGNIRDISLSGGEPILREDILKIVELIIRYSNPKSLSIPSNGLMPERLANISQEILQKNPNLKLLINLSIDGPKKIHDDIRGVKGSFEKSIKSAERLIELRKRYPQLFININTVITNQNIDLLPDFMDYVKNNLDIDGHYFEIIRGDSNDKNISIPEINKLKEFYEIALKNEEYYFNKRFEKGKVGLNLGKKLTKMFYIGIIKYLYYIQMKVIKGKKWDFRCSAGKTSLVIYPNGQVSMCELKPADLNLKNFDYDIKKLRNSQTWKNKLEIIRITKCSCTHDCFIYNTINHNPITRFIRIPLGYFR